MAYAGQTISNPISGEEITFIRTAADTGGRLLEFELRLTTDGHVPGAHVHPEQEERFHVISGTMEFRLGLRKVVAGPGESVVVPAGAIHRFRNGGDTEAHVRVEVEPALKMEELLETTVELAHEGRTTSKGMPRPVHLALFTREYEREVRAPFPPAPLVRALLAPLAWFGRRRGHAERYARGAEVIALPSRPLPASPARRAA